MKALICLVSIVFSMSTFADTYTKYDYESGNTYSVSTYGDTTTVNGYNINTGSTWSQTSRSDGTYSGRDSNGDYYSGNNNSGSYYNTNGTTCFGRGTFRTCN